MTHVAFLHVLAVALNNSFKERGMHATFYVTFRLLPVCLLEAGDIKKNCKKKKKKRKFSSKCTWLVTQTDISEGVFGCNTFRTTSLDS